MKFEDLKAWQKARLMANVVYCACKGSPLGRDFGLRDQIQRAAVSVMNNCAEGFERIHQKEKIQFYNAAKASAGEVKSMTYLLEDLEMADPEQINRIRLLASDSAALLQGLIKSTRAETK